MSPLSKVLWFTAVETTNSPFRRAVLLTVCALPLVLPPLPLVAQEAGGNEEAALPKPAVELRVQTSGTLRDGHFFVRVRIQAADLDRQTREPLNLALVFDRSGSMDTDSKIGYLRRAGRLVVENLTRQDYVALVAYNHRVQTLVPLHPVVNREYLYHRIDELYAEGNTNISGGLLEGCAQLQKRLDEPGRHHVILLTDGLANRGVTNPKALVRLVDRCTKNGITITTVGVGTDYDEKLLSRMAEAGNGRYVYVGSGEEIPTALKRELGDLLPVVAQNVKISLPLPANVDVVHDFASSEPPQPGIWEVSLGDLSSGEERVLLVELAMASQSEKPLDLQATLTYDDVAEASRTETGQTITVETAATGVSQASSRNQPVLAYARLVKALDKIALAVNGMDRPLAGEVLRIRREQYPELKKAAQASRDQDFVNKAFLFEHYARELQTLIDRGALHEHSRERARLQKEFHYRRYLMDHHRHVH